MKLNKSILSFRDKIQTILDDENNVYNSKVELILFVVILLSVLFIFAEMMLPSGHRYVEMLKQINHIFLIFFIVEFCIRFLAHFSRKCFFYYITSAFFWIDLICILPAFRIFRSVRILKLLRVLRVVKLGRYQYNILNLVESISTFFAMNNLQMILIGGTISFIIISATIALKSINPNLSFNEAFWWSLVRIIDSGFVDVKTGSSTIEVLLSVGVTLTGVTIFGLFVGLSSNLFMQYFNNLHHSSRSLKLENHYLLCNWGNSTMMKQLIQELVQHNCKASILSLHNIMERPNSRKYHFRLGDCTSPEHLVNKGAVLSAETIIVFLDKSSEENEKNSENRTMLTLMVLFELLQENETPFLRNIIIESNSNELTNWIDVRFKGKLEPSDNLNIIVIDESKLIAQLLIQSGINTYLSSIYAELFTHTGQELYIASLENIYPNNDVEKINFFQIYNEIRKNTKKEKKCLQKRLQCNNLPLPIGIVSEKGIYLNPKPNYTVKRADKVILIADVSKEKNEKNIIKRKDNTSIKINRNPSTIVITSWNDNVDDLIYEAVSYGITNIFVLSENYKMIPNTEYIFTEDDTQKKVDIISQEIELNSLEVQNKKNHIYVSYIKEDPSTLTNLSHILEKHAINIMISVSDKATIERGNSADARTIKTLFQVYNTETLIVSEIMDEPNRKHAHTAGADSVVLSPITIGNYIMQIARRKEISNVFEQLLSVRGKEIYTIENTGQFKTKSFHELFKYFYKERRVLLFGYIDAENKVILNPQEDLIENAKAFIGVCKKETFIRTCENIYVEKNYELV